MTYIIWAVLIYIAIGQAEEENSSLTFLHVLFRHGARSPVKLFSGDPNSPDEIWPEGLGKLTQLGRKQHYGLGKFLRSHYSGFVTSNPNEILVNSTEKDRCLRSALSNLASFYAPIPPWAFDDEINWQPIPVHYSPLAQDKYLNMESDCPRFFAEIEKRFNSSDFLDMVAKFKPLIEVLRMHGAFTDWLNYSKILDLHDTVTIEKAKGLPLPPWIEPHCDDLAELNDILLNYSFDSEVQHRLRAGPILGKMIETMDEKIAGNIGDLKIQMFSAQDINIVAILQALRLFNNVWPPYCVTVLFELHEKPSGSKEVRMLFLNSTRPEDVTSHVPRVLQLEGCPEFCPLERFRAITKHLIPDNWDLECQL